MSRNDSNNYKEIFLSGAPMIDLRAPCEFSLGAFPTSKNLPLMNDSEREAIGICYKKHGQDAAIKLGHHLVKDKNKNDKILQWKQFATLNKDTGYFYCFRGGLRSRTSQQWLSDIGIELPIIIGGYKSMRRYLIDVTERLIDETDILVLSGYTGTAKTKFLKTQNNSIDLEELANHRGSSFGRNLTPQPTQINFENNLAIELLNFESKNIETLLLEDESRLIGARSLPLSLKNKMDCSDIVMIEENFDYRVSQIYEDYVVNLFNEFELLANRSGSIATEDEPVLLYKKFLESSTLRIKKRLGGAGLKQVMGLIDSSIENQIKTGDCLQHKSWITYLLKHYYDPMYLYQVMKKKKRIIFKGNTTEVNRYFEESQKALL